jgi:hypothetical protein
LLWLEEGVSDLARCQRRWRIFDAPAEDHELSHIHYINKLFTTIQDQPWEPPMIKKSIDVVRFASNKDAVYFKMRFL